eukprot:TRINITY_DN5817_c0_g1_i1.p1 TRINITY_DN5817_c0_g1~~TRINITY_DN5817_c0_g1_i1.p1  ORF type:complete len:554 (+),score=151.84 TRINITY_DN5817_c0_g1_i1:117-1778(+)
MKRSLDRLYDAGEGGADASKAEKRARFSATPLERSVRRLKLSGGLAIAAVGLRSLKWNGRLLAWALPGVATKDVACFLCTLAVCTVAEGAVWRWLQPQELSFSAGCSALGRLTKRGWRSLQGIAEKADEAEASADKKRKSKGEPGSRPRGARRPGRQEKQQQQQQQPQQSGDAQELREQWRLGFAMKRHILLHQQNSQLRSAIDHARNTERHATQMWHLAEERAEVAQRRLECTQESLTRAMCDAARWRRQYMRKDRRKKKGRTGDEARLAKRRPSRRHTGSSRGSGGRLDSDSDSEPPALALPEGFEFARGTSEEADAQEPEANAVEAPDAAEEPLVLALPGPSTPRSSLVQAGADEVPEPPEDDEIPARQEGDGESACAEDSDAAGCRTPLPKARATDDAGMSESSRCGKNKQRWRGSILTRGSVATPDTCLGLGATPSSICQEEELRDDDDPDEEAAEAVAAAMHFDEVEAGGGPSSDGVEAAGIAPSCPEEPPRDEGAETVAESVSSRAKASGSRSSIARGSGVDFLKLAVEWTETTPASGMPWVQASD